MTKHHCKYLNLVHTYTVYGEEMEYGDGDWLSKLFFFGFYVIVNGMLCVLEQRNQKKKEMRRGYEV